MKKHEPILIISTIEGRSSKPAKIIPQKDLQHFVNEYKIYLDEIRGVEE